MKEWEVWFASFPYDDNPNILKQRPVIVLNVEPLEVLSVKVTTHDVRDSDDYDTPIVYWKEAGLNHPSIARVSKTIYLSQSNFKYKLGELHIDDKNAILNKYVGFLKNKE